MYKILVIIMLLQLCHVCHAWSGLDRDDVFIVEKTTAKTYSFDSRSLPGRKLVVDVTSGSINVRGHDSSEIQAQVTEHLQGRQQADLAQAEKELKLIVEQTSYGLLTFLETPYRDSSYLYFQRSRDYRFRYDVNLEVPHDMALELYHVRQGDVRLSGISGTIRIDTAQGDVILADVLAAGSVKTITGDIILAYTRMPDVDLALHSRFGDMYCGFDYRLMPVPAMPVVSRDGALTRYSKDSFARIRLARGGPSMTLDSISGDILVRDNRK